MYFRSVHDSKRLMPEHYEVFRNPEQQILIINNHHFIRNMLKIIFENMGYTVVTADTGWEGMALFQMHPQRFEMVILDTAMSHGSGAALLQEIRGLNTGQKILMISGQNEMQEVGDIFEDQQTVLFRLPFSLRKLARTVAAMISR